MDNLFRSYADCRTDGPGTGTMAGNTADEVVARDIAASWEGAALSGNLAIIISFKCNAVSYHFIVVHRNAAYKAYLTEYPRNYTFDLGVSQDLSVCVRSRIIKNQAYSVPPAAGDVVEALHLPATIVRRLSTHHWLAQADMSLSMSSNLLRHGLKTSVGMVMPLPP